MRKLKEKGVTGYTDARGKSTKLTITRVKLDEKTNVSVVCKTATRNVSYTGQDYCRSQRKVSMYRMWEVHLLIIMFSSFRVEFITENKWIYLISKNKNNSINLEMGAK